MQIQHDYQQLPRKLLSRDISLELLFKQEQIEQVIMVEKNLQNKSIQRINHQEIQKGYLSEGYQKMPSNKINIRKNSIIQKMKLKQKKRKTKKTKLYIEMLESRVYQLQKELESAKKLNQMNRQYLKKLSQGEHIVNGLFVSKQRHIQSFQFLLSQKQINSEALKKQYSNMRFRHGVYGKDRTKAINYYFSQISELFFSDTLKYLIKTAQNKQDFFSPEFLDSGYIYPKQQSKDDIVSILRLPIQSKGQLIYLSTEILNQKKNLDEKFQTFYKTKCDIMKVSRKMEMIIDTMQRYCNHQQISKLILFADQYRWKKCISVKEFYKDVFDKLSNETYSYDSQNLFGKSLIN